MPEQQTQTPDFIPATAPASTQETPDFIPAIPATMPQQSDQTPDFIPQDPNQKPSEGSGFLTQIYNGFKNLDVKDFQKFGRKASVESIPLVGPVLGPLADKLENSIKSPPTAPVFAGKGAWDTTKNVANVPFLVTFH